MKAVVPYTKLELVEEAPAWRIDSLITGRRQRHGGRRAPRA
jgi:hypothetical protein